MATLLTVQLPGESQVYAPKVTTVYLTEAMPTSLELIGSGGVAASGAATVPLVEQEVGSGGVQVSGHAVAQHEPLVYVASGGVQLNGSADQFTGTGGTQVSGAATIAVVNIKHWDEYGLGGVKASGAATDAWDWTTTAGSGGLQASGTATVSALITVSGALDATLPKMTALLRQPYMDVTLPKMTVALGPNGNMMGATLPSMSATIGPEAPAGALEATLSLMQADATALLGTAGSIDAKMQPLEASVDGGTFRIDVSIPTVSASMTAKTGAVGVVDAVLPAMQAYSGGTATVLATMSVQLPTVEPTVTALAGNIGAISTLLPKLRQALTAVRGSAATITATLEPMAASMTGHTQAQGSMVVTLPNITASATAEQVLFEVVTLCMNLTTASLSQYADYAFDSFCEYNGKYYAAGPGGLYEIEQGDTDAGAQIDAVFETGDLDFNSEYQKRISDFYAGYRTKGDLALTITTDETGVVDYTLRNYGNEALHQRRVTTAKGAKGKYWRFKVANTDGCDFEIDTMNMAVVPVARRI